jgi:hypothetical protein
MNNFKSLNTFYTIDLVKNMLLAFRMNIYAKELIPQVVGSLKAVVLSNWNTESIRTIATFLASTVSNSMFYNKMRTRTYISNLFIYT